MAEDKNEVIHKLAVLRDDFEAGLSDRLRQLEEALEGVTTGGDADHTGRSLEALHGLSHKLRGAAGTFGFASASDIAGRLEILAEDLLGRERQLDDSDRDALLRVFSSLQAECAGGSARTIVDAAAWEILATARETDDEAIKTIILVDDDEGFLTLVQNQLTHFGFDVIALADHSELREAVAATPPAAVIMDVAFPGDFDAGVATIGALRDEGVVSCPVVFLSVRGDLPARLGAVRAGGDGYLVKPVDLAELVELLDRLTNRVGEEAYRVVIVDDDAEVANFHAALLSQAGMETAVVTDPMAVMAPIRELRPDVILMDIRMPECDGFELAKVIRQEKAFVQIPIVFLTGSDIEDAWLQAMKAGGDEFLRKTIEPKELLASIFGRARRARDLNAVLDRLGESHTRFRAVAESAQEAIITADAKGRVVYWNGGAREAFGYENTEILGRPISTLIPEALRQGREREFQSLAADEAATTSDTTIETVGLRKDGGEFPIEISSAAWRIGSQAYATSIIRDITAHKQAETALSSSEQRFRRIFEQSDVGLWDEDFSQVYIELERLRESGVQNLRAYFREHPQAAAELASSITINRVNNATLRLFGAESQEEPPRKMPHVCSLHRWRGSSH